MQKVKVTNAHTLEQEIARLKKRSRELELELAGRVDYFKGNYGKMAINSVIPGAASGQHKGWFNIGMRIAGIAWQSGNVKTFATRALMTILEFVGVRLGINLFNQYQQQRRKKRARKKAERRKARMDESNSQEEY
ncbi:hypothetical protein [Chitinophaga japonensis]|uniref:Uncharacterized protein n=1 Tax=Chitinophaga japonensis TaxID=104662 RepID=A0A562TFK7_CHIJA|nr:hypothetical protein [Chitinophaga japonensis]TWI91760.1 hypothetical protein LX66_1140 [Chitinophaga japonensis]